MVSLRTTVTSSGIHVFGVRRVDQAEIVEQEGETRDRLGAGRDVRREMPRRKVRHDRSAFHAEIRRQPFGRHCRPQGVWIQTDAIERAALVRRFFVRYVPNETVEEEHLAKHLGHLVFEPWQGTKRTVDARRTDAWRLRTDPDGRPQVVCERRDDEQLVVARGNVNDDLRFGDHPAHARRHVRFGPDLHERRVCPVVWV